MLILLQYIRQPLRISELATKNPTNIDGFVRAKIKCKKSSTEYLLLVKSLISYTSYVKAKSKMNFIMG